MRTTNEIARVNTELQILSDAIKEGGRIREQNSTTRASTKFCQFFCTHWQKLNGEEESIETLLIDNTVKSPHRDILNHCFNLYKELLSQNTDHHNAWLKGIPHLAQDEQEVCVGPYTYSECWMAVTQMAIG